MSHPETTNSFAEKLIDSQLETFSFRDLIARIFLRPKLFLFALLAPPVIAVFMSSLVPVEWSASNKILIRYSAADSGLLAGLVSDSRLGLSGTTSAELIKSTPVLERTIQDVGITEHDIYKKSSQVISDAISGLIGGLFSNKAKQTDADPQDVLKNRALIQQFKASLDSSSKKSSNAKSIEILEKTSQVPENMKLDELITLEVKSFNREKVANMANGLANAFIDEYYRLYAEEAKKQFIYLDNLVLQEEEELKRVESARPADFAHDNVQSNSSGRELLSRDVPILNSMATQLMQTEGELTRATQIYASSSPQVRRLSAQVANLKFMLKKQERIEISKQLLEQLKAKRYQALNTESVYKNRLVPISIAEQAVEPPGSSSRKLIRLVISGVIGTVLGSMLAVGLMVMLNVIDPRVHFKKDVEKLVAKPIVSYLPKLKRFKLTDYRLLRDDKNIEQGIWQLIARVGQKPHANQAKVIAISSPAKGDGASFCALALAMGFAKNKKNRVCLIDASFGDATLTNLYHLNTKQGLLEGLIEGSVVDKVNEESADLFVVGTGNLNLRSELGYYADAANSLLAELKALFDYIIIDTGAALKNNEAMVFGLCADETLLAVSAGVSRKGMLQAALAKLEPEGVKVTGVIFNQSKEVLPAFIYRML